MLSETERVPVNSKEVVVSSGNKTWPTAVDLFCGAGSASAALKQSHFRVVAAVDNDANACATYRANHPRSRLYETDIQDLDPLTVRSECLDALDLDLMVICAPCQPFSSQNRRRNTDQRSRLLLQGARFVSALRPKILFVENVPALASRAYADLLTEFRNICGSEYRFGSPQRVDAADYGVPQRRIRCLLMAGRGVPAPTLPPPISPQGERFTVRHAISSLAKLKSGEADKHDPLHVARNHKPIALERLRAIAKDGGSRRELPKALRLNCHKQPNCFPDVYGRMSWDDVAPTLTTGCTDVTRGRFAHPEADRAITPREAALLQTFPPHYTFEGSLKVVAQQIGNALPFALLRALAPTLRASIRTAR